MSRSRSTRFPLRLAMLLAALLAFAAVPAVASADDRYVAVDGIDDSDCLDEADPCKTIQYAVDVSDPGDIVNVGPGTYNESVVVSLPVAIVGPIDCGCTDVPEGPDKSEKEEGTDPPSDIPELDVIDESARGGDDEARIVGVGSNPAIEVISDDVMLIGLAFGPEAGPASGTGVVFRPEATGSVVGYSLFEHLLQGIRLDGVDEVQIALNIFRDHDAPDSAAIAGDEDTETEVYWNIFRRNTRSFDLDGSDLAWIMQNRSRGDATFVESHATSDTVIWINDVRGLTDTGVSLNADDAPDVSDNEFTGDGTGVTVNASSGTPVVDPMIVTNDFHGLGGNGVHVADGAADWVGVYGNRFFATGGAGLLVDGGPGVYVDATNNWWGCNEGPNQDGCDEYSAPNGATIEADPWTVMTLLSDHSAIDTGGDWTYVAAAFYLNSDGEEIYNGIPDGAEVAFSTTLGTVDPETECTCGGEAEVELISGDEPGTAMVTANLDAESQTIPILFRGPWARIAPDGFDFGPVAFGSFSPLQKFTVKNTGNRNLNISTVGIGGAYAPDFQLTQNTCSGVLTPGEFCSVKVRFVPTGSPGGLREATLVVDSNVPSGSNEVELTGTAVGSSFLRVTPDPFSFGEIPVGSVSPQQKFTARNIDSDDITIDAVDLAGADPSQYEKTADTCTGQTIAPDETCFVRVRFKPTNGGDKTATLQFRRGETTVATAELSGTATTIPDVRITPASFSFGDVVVGEKSPYKKWTVKNTGGAPITVESVDLQGDDAGQFQRAAYGCANVTLQPGEYCTLKVRFRPTGAPGPRAAQLVVASDVPGTHTAELTGTAVGI